LSQKGISLKVIKIIALNSFFMLAACAGLEMKPEKEAAVDVKKAKESIELEKQTAISPKVMFLLLTAEVAGQRGQYGIALDGYLRAAAIEKDIDVIKRSASIAVFLQDEKKLDEAVGYWLEIDENDLEARHLKAVAAIQGGRNVVAIEQINFILDKAPQDFDVRMQIIVKNLRKQESFRVAYDVFTTLSAQHPANESFYFILAYLDYQAKQYLPAQQKLKQALEIKSHWVKALLLQGQVYIGQNKLELATESLQQAVAEEENAKISEQIAQLLINQNRFNEALDVLDELSDKNPGNNAIKMQQALVMLQLDSGSDGAEKILLELVEVAKYRDQCLYYLGRIAVSKKQHQSALNWFDAVAEGKYKYEANVSVVLVLMKENRLNEALLRVEQVKQAYPQKADKLVLIESEVLSRKKQYQQAFDVLSSALLKSPENSDILYARALMAEKTGDIKTLEDDLKYILEKRPNDATALNALGYTLVDKTQRYEEARGYIEKALAIKPNEAVFIDSYGWLFFKMGRFEEAKKQLEKAYALQPQAEIAGHLVEVLSALNQHKGAKELLMKALKLNADDDYLLALKQQLLNE